MFAHCRAYVVAANSNESHALELTARWLGFGEVAIHGAPRQHSRARVTYFLLDWRLGDQAMLEVIEQIREDHADPLCYSPVILMIDDCSTQTVLKYVRFGFDDVICLPEPRDILESRLAAQLFLEQVYIETNDYLGPDRRRLDANASAGELRIGVVPYTRVSFQRDPLRGIRVLGRERRGQHFRMHHEHAFDFVPRLFGHDEARI